MNRFAEMHDCPLFWQREVVATFAAFARSADGITTKASEPPSSSTTFFSDSPAVRPTATPAPSLPVSVAAATRSSRRIFSTLPLPTSRVWKTSSGKPASRNSSSMNSAVWGTLLACLSRPTLPAARAGAAKRIACQSGKFHGMIASTTPSGR